MPNNIEDRGQKSLVITFCGASNVGKSTLLNRLLGCKISICSPKPQTTRDNIRGVLTKNDTQLVFVDTPGIFHPKRSELEKQIVKEAWKGMAGTDLICLMLDCQLGLNKSAEMILKKLSNNQNVPVVCVVNKADLVKMDDKILLAKRLSELQRFVEIFFLSAKTSKGCDKLIDFFLENAKQKPWLFNEDDLTDKDNNYFASEFVREQLFLILQKEIPYSLFCETENFSYDKDVANISVVVYVGKQNHKKIILGKNGSNIKRIIRFASSNLEELIGCNVALKIFIKVDEKRFYF